MRIVWSRRCSSCQRIWLLCMGCWALCSPGRYSCGPVRGLCEQSAAASALGYSELAARHFNARTGNGTEVVCIEAPKPARCNAGTSGNVKHQSESMLHATAWLVACCTLRHYTKPEVLPEGQQPLCHSQTQGHGIPKHGGWQALIIARQDVYNNGIASKPGSTASLCRNTSGAHRSNS